MPEITEKKVTTYKITAQELSDLLKKEYVSNLGEMGNVLIRKGAGTITLAGTEFFEFSIVQSISVSNVGNSVPSNVVDTTKNWLVPQKPKTVPQPAWNTQNIPSETPVIEAPVVQQDKEVVEDDLPEIDDTGDFIDRLGMDDLEGQNIIELPEIDNTI